ncbi:MAG: WD40 repeat domain-containing protein [Myxococcaceae bacterium]
MASRRSIKQVPSRLSKLEKALAAVLPRGLPKDVRRFYAKTDGLKVTCDGETFVLAGLAEMFGGLKGGAFRKHVVVKKKGALDELAWHELPHCERFFVDGEEADDAKALAALNLRMRLKLLVSVPGESTEFGIDFEGRSPVLYVVDRAATAYALKGLGFDEFVDWFSKFGARRWYYAFLDKKDEASLNIDLLAELERSLERFPREEWAPLLARMPKKRAAGPVKVVVAAGGAGSAVDVGAFPSLTDAPLVVGGKDSPRQVAFSPDGRRLLVWDGEYGLSLYDVGSRKVLWKQKKAYRAALSPDGKVVAVLEQSAAFSGAGLLVLRDAASGKPMHKAPWKCGAELETVGWLGERVVVVDAGETVHVIAAATQSEVKSVRAAMVREVRGLGTSSRLVVRVQKFDPGAMVLVGPSAVQVLDVESGAEVQRWKGASTIAVSADGAVVALRFAAAKSVVRIVEVATGRVRAEVPCGNCSPDEDPAYGFHLAFSGDGALLAVADRSFDAKTRGTTSAITIYDAKSGGRVGRVELGHLPERPTATIDAEGLAFSTDHIICAATGSAGLRFWRV